MIFSKRPKNRTDTVIVTNVPRSAGPEVGATSNATGTVTDIMSILNRGAAAPDSVPLVAIVAVFSAASPGRVG